MQSLTPRSRRPGAGGFPGRVAGPFLGGSIISDGPHLDIAAQGRVPALGLLSRDADFDVTDGFRETTLNDSQIVVHLKGPVLGRRVAEPVHRAGVSLSEYMRHTPAVPQQLDSPVVTGLLRGPFALPSTVLHQR